MFVAAFLGRMGARGRLSDSRHGRERERDLTGWFTAITSTPDHPGVGAQAASGPTARDLGLPARQNDTA